MHTRWIVLLPLFVLPFAFGCGGQVQKAPADAVRRVAICGHLYSLYVPNKTEDPADLFGWETPLAALERELLRLEPEKTFFLGDNTRYSKEEEWDFVEAALERVPGEKIWVAGNHDYRGKEVFLGRGGTRNASFVVGDYKFITLDAKSILEAEDRAFLERELADWESYQEVFLLMHFFLPNYDDPEEGAELDPYEAYTGFSNWNRDIVPILAGRVRYIFVGDYYPRHLDWSTHVFGEHELHYIQNAFLFGRNKSSNTTGDGPMIFLELELGSDDFRIVPHAVPLDVRDPWYRNFRRLKTVWATHAMDEGRFSIELPADWRILTSEEEDFAAHSIDPTEWKRKHIEVERVAGAEPTTAAALADSVRDTAGEDVLLNTSGPPLLKLHGQPVPWFVGAGPGGAGTQLTVCLAAEGRGYLVRVRGPKAEGGDPTTLLEILRSIKVGGTELELPPTR